MSSFGTERPAQPPDPAPRTSPRWLDSPWLLCLILALAVGLTYSNSLRGGFLYDDYGDILDNSSIQSLWPLKDVFFARIGARLLLLGRPLVNLTFAINHATGGMNTLHYHLTNLAIHLLAALSLLGVARRTLSLPRLRKEFQGAIPLLSLLIALLWALHPLQTESVSYITQRYESLMGLFALLTFYCVIRTTDSRRPTGWALGAALSCLLALACKEVAVSLPILILLYDRAFLAGSFRNAWRQRRVLYLGLVLAWAGFAYLQTHTVPRGFAGFGLSMPWWRYALSQPGVILHYLRLTVWPHPLCLDYDWPEARTWGQILPGMVVVIGLLLASLVALFRSHKLGFFGAFFFLILAPTSSIMPILDLAVEHRMYLPLAPLMALAVIGGFRASRWLKHRFGLSSYAHRMGMLALVASTLATLGVLTYLRNEDYRSPLDIWMDAVAKAPHNPRTHFNYAHALNEAGYLEPAIQEYKRASALAPTAPYPYNNLGVLLGQHGRLQESLENLRTAIKLKPDEAKFYVNLGVTLLNKKSADNAIICFQRAIEIDPRISADALNNIGQAFLQKGQIDKAIEYYRMAINSNYKTAVFHWNLATCLLKLGREEEARSSFLTAIHLNPDPVDATSKFAWVLFSHRQDREATLQLREALRQKPEHLPSLMRLGWILATSPDASIRNGPEAMRLAETALRVSKSRSPEILDLLGVAYAECGKFQEASAVTQEGLQSSPTRNEPWFHAMQKHLDHYQSGQAFRDTERIN